MGFLKIETKKNIFIAEKHGKAKVLYNARSALSGFFACSGNCFRETLVE